MFVWKIVGKNRKKMSQKLSNCKRDFWRNMPNCQKNPQVTNAHKAGEVFWKISEQNHQNYFWRISEDIVKGIPKEITGRMSEGSKRRVYIGWIPKDINKGIRQEIPWLNYENASKNSKCQKNFWRTIFERLFEYFLQELSETLPVVFLGRQLR